MITVVQSGVKKQRETLEFSVDLVSRDNIKGLSSLYRKFDEAHLYENWLVIAVESEFSPIADEFYELFSAAALSEVFLYCDCGKPNGFCHAEIIKEKIENLVIYKFL